MQGSEASGLGLKGFELWSSESGVFWVRVWVQGLWVWSLRSAGLLCGRSRHASKLESIFGVANYQGS